MESTKEMLPLTEGFYYILLCLYQAPAHGYGIMQDVEKMTLGRVRIGPGTLYTALNTLLKKEFILDLPSSDSTDSRRKMYAITESGKRIVAVEIERLQELVDNGRKSMKAREE